MKNFLFMVLCIFIAQQSWSQEDKSKRPSPPDLVHVLTDTGNEITIQYSKPSLKGRTLGVDIAPLGEVWRTGANEATVFELTKDADIDGKKLAKGKYSLYSIPGEGSSTIIFNKVWNQWGTKYDEKEDALRVDVPTAESETFMEQFTIRAAKSGLIEFLWGDYKMYFTVK